MKRRGLRQRWPHRPLASVALYAAKFYGMSQAVIETLVTLYLKGGIRTSQRGHAIARLVRAAWSAAGGYRGAMLLPIDLVTLADTVGHRGLFAIICAEAGLPLDRFLPDDSALFAAGACGLQGSLALRVVCRAASSLRESRLSPARFSCRLRPSSRGTAARRSCSCASPRSARELGRCASRRATSRAARAPARTTTSSDHRRHRRGLGPPVRRAGGIGARVWARCRGGCARRLDTVRSRTVRGPTKRRARWLVRIPPVGYNVTSDSITACDIPQGRRGWGDR